MLLNKKQLYPIAQPLGLWPVSRALSYAFEEKQLARMLMTISQLARPEGRQVILSK